MNDQLNTAPVPATPRPAEKPLMWFSWIGGAVALITALFAPQGAAALTLLGIGIAVLVVAIVATTQRSSRRRALQTSRSRRA